MDKVAVIIPSRTEKFLDNTIRDVLKNATGEIVVYPILDGYDCPRVEDPRVEYICLPPTPELKKRHGINAAVAKTDAKYVMALDAHCMVAPGFDTQLVHDHQEDWIQIPRRHRLDAENWCLQPQGDARPPIDYEYLMYPGRTGKNGLHGFKWDARTLERMHIPIDDTLTFQGSCWFMTKEWFNKMGFMQIEGYTGWGQEAEELSFTTRLNGGHVKTNKNTWYAHLHKGPRWGRMYYMSRAMGRAANDYCYNKWVYEHKDFFISVLEQFMPMPGWPEDWKEALWKL